MPTYFYNRAIKEMSTVTKVAVAKLMDEFFKSCQQTREEGQKEYAQDESNALANFERSAERSGTTREQAWSIFAGKHWDGIMAHVKGHHSQREPVEGRIKDLVVYLVLYLAMTKQNELYKTAEGVIQDMIKESNEKYGSAMDAAPTKDQHYDNIAKTYPDKAKVTKEIGDPNDR